MSAPHPTGPDARQARQQSKVLSALYDPATPETDKRMLRATVAGMVVRDIRDGLHMNRCMLTEWPYDENRTAACFDRQWLEAASGHEQTSAAIRRRELSVYASELAEHETRMSATIATVLRAARWALDAGAEDLCAELLQHVYVQWGQRMASPPPDHAAGPIADRLSKRYDLLPHVLRKLLA